MKKTLGYQGFSSRGAARIRTGGGGFAMRLKGQNTIQTRCERCRAMPPPRRLSLGILRGVSRLGIASGTTRCSKVGRRCLGRAGYHSRYRSHPGHGIAPERTRGPRMRCKPSSRLRSRPGGQERKRDAHTAIECRWTQTSLVVVHGPTASKAIGAGVGPLGRSRSCPDSPRFARSPRILNSR